MTQLKKPVKRRTTIFLDSRIKARDCDLVTVTLHPNNTIGFRANHSRKEYTYPLAKVYRAAILAHEVAEKAKREEEKQQRRIARGLPAKPKKRARR